MSDLLGGDPSLLPSGSGQAENGGLRPSAGAPTSQSPGPKTPREVMADRRKREQAKKENEEIRRRLAEQEEEEARRRNDAARAGVAGGNGGESGAGRTMRPQDESSYRRPPGASGSSQPGERRSGRGSNGNGTKPSAATGPTNVPSGGERAEPMATRRDQGNGNGAATVPSSRPRTGSQGQIPQGGGRDAAPRTSALPPQQPQVSSQDPNQSYRARDQQRSSQPQTQPQTRTSTAIPPSAQPQARNTTQQASRTGAEGSRSRNPNPNQSSFPHAFERWETLSSHWEGLTSYWIRRLQDNSSEINQQPLNQQMSRQITDLSAAGANLFHAVVELQRLRASSERKFQRWFLETSSEKERSLEVQAELQTVLNRERELRAEASRAVARLDGEKLSAQRMVEEMKRELQISKEEARRAWEELGRREQEERDRTRSLREGEPTVVGGVQVVPMAAGLSRGPSLANRPPTREGPYSGGPTAATLGGQDDPRFAESRIDPSTHTDDPFYEQSRQDRPSTSGSAGPDLPIQGTTTAPPIPASSAGIVRNYPNVPLPQTQPIVSTAASPRQTTTSTAPASRGFYQHQGIALSGSGPSGATTATALAHPDFPDDETFSGSDEPEIDEHGNFRRDAQGRRIPFQASSAPSGQRIHPDNSEDEDEFDTHAPGFGDPRYGAAGVSAVSNGALYGGAVGGTDAPRFTQAGYSGGQSYGGWEDVRTHHHPTRLSDVLEEDERSRTSPSRASMDNGSRR